MKNNKSLFQDFDWNSINEKITDKSEALSRIEHPNFWLSVGEKSELILEIVFEIKRKFFLALNGKKIFHSWKGKKKKKWKKRKKKMKNLSRSHINKMKHISDKLKGGGGSEIGHLIKATYLGCVEYFFLHSVYFWSISLHWY